MSLLIFAIIVLVIAILLAWLIDSIPLGYPINVIAKAAVILAAVVIICNQAGFL